MPAHEAEHVGESVPVHGIRTARDHHGRRAKGSGKKEPGPNVGDQCENWVVSFIFTRLGNKPFREPMAQRQKKNARHRIGVD